MEPVAAGPGQPRCDDAAGRRATAAAHPGATVGSNGGEGEEEAAARATALHDFVAYLKTNGLAEEDFTVNASAIPRHFRVNPLFDAAADPDVVAKGGLLSTLAQDFGTRPRLLQWLPASCQVYEIDATVNLTASELFTRKAHGRWHPAVYGIDASSCAAAVALAPRPGDHVLDLCCAPGAKLTLLANLMHHRGTLTGVDVSTERLRPTWKMLVRYGVADAHSEEGLANPAAGGSTMSGGSGDGTSKLDTNPWHLRVFQGDGTTFALGPPPLPSAARGDRGDSDGSGSGGGSGGDGSGGDGSGTGDDDSGSDVDDGGSGSGNATAGCGVDGGIGGGGNDVAAPLLILDSRERAAWPPRTRKSLKMNRAARASMVAAEAGVAARAAHKATTHALVDGGTDRKRARVGSDAPGSKCCSNGRDDDRGGGGGRNGDDETIGGFGDMESEVAAAPQPPPPPSPAAAAPPSLLYDRVLVDAECTHDGSVRHISKFRDWGWHTFAARVLDPQRLRELPVTQRGLLLNGFRLLRPGGTLVYATCSLCRAQNEDVVEWFLGLPQVRACRGTHLVPIEFEGATAPIPARACVGTAQLAAAAASVAPAASSSSLSPPPQSAAASAAAGAGASDALRHCLRFSPRVSRTSGLFVAKFVKGDRSLASTAPDGEVAATPRRALQGAMRSP